MRIAICVDKFVFVCMHDECAFVLISLCSCACMMNVHLC
jgi:hypothetical protein